MNRENRDMSSFYSNLSEKDIQFESQFSSFVAYWNKIDNCPQEHQYYGMAIAANKGNKIGKTEMC